MTDLHAATLEFVYNLLKKQQLRVARAARRPSSEREEKALVHLQHRLILELSYGNRTP